MQGGNEANVIIWVRMQSATQNLVFLVHYIVYVHVAYKLPYELFSTLNNNSNGNRCHLQIYSSKYLTVASSSCTMVAAGSDQCNRYKGGRN